MTTRCMAVGLLLALSATTAQAQDLNTEFNGALNALLKEGAAKALPKFTVLVETRWKEMSPKGKHGAANLLMFCQAACGKTQDVNKQGAWFFKEMPKAFSSLADFSAGDTPDEKLGKLRGSIHLLSLRAGKGSSLLYLHNSSDKPIDITESKFDVSFGYKTKTTSVGDVTTNGSPAFTGAVHLPAGGGRVVQSSSGGGFLAMALPDCVAIFACSAKNRLPGWIHLVMEDYSQTLNKVHITADVKWGTDELKGVAIAKFDKPAEGPKKGAAPDTPQADDKPAKGDDD